jgi:pyridoxine 4-dehydrogenase
MLPSGHSPQERIMAHDRPAARSGTFVIGGDLPVHRLGFGAMRITGKGIWGPPEDPDEAIRVLRRCLELGIDFIDTADSYGPEVSERLIAEALHPYPPELVIATKAGLRRPGPDQWRPDGRPEYLRAQVLSSLQRLQLERIDLLQLHRLDPKVPLRDQIGALARLQHEGRIRHIGVSEVSVAELRMVRELVEVVTVQNLYNLADRKSEDVLDYCEAEGIGFIPWFPLATGELAAPGGPLARAAARLGAAPSQVALAWLLHRSPVMLPIPGTSKVRHLEENAAAALLELDEETIRELDLQPA